MNGPETLTQKFTRYQALKLEGMSAEDICKKMSREFLDHGNMIDMLQRIFGLSEAAIHQIISSCEQELYGAYFSLKAQGKPWEFILDTLKKDQYNFIQVVYILTTPLQFSIPLRGSKQRFYDS
jgi:hypothetical protein